MVPKLILPRMSVVSSSVGVHHNLYPTFLSFINLDPPTRFHKNFFFYFNSYNKNPTFGSCLNIKTAYQNIVFICDIIELDESHVGNIQF